MPAIDPLVRSALVDLHAGFQANRIPYCVIGALAPELLLGVPQQQRTNDADVVVLATSIADFESLKTHLQSHRFEPTPLDIRLQHKTGARVDVLPFSEKLAPRGTLELRRDLIFNMAGFRHVFAHTVQVDFEGLILPVVALRLFVLLKLVAYSDRKDPRDLVGVLHCLRHFDADSQRLYGLEYLGALVPFDVASAFLLGVEASQFMQDEQVRPVVRGVLEVLVEPDLPGIDVVSRGEGRTTLDPERRREISDRFLWFSRPWAG